MNLRRDTLAYVDWKSQEVAIAAQLSGDPALLDAVSSGDPYLAFAKMAGLAPMDATKQSHKAIRDVCKVCVCWAPTTACRPRAWPCGPGCR